MFSQHLLKILFWMILVAIPAWLLIRSFFGRKQSMRSTFLQIIFIAYCMAVLALTVVPLPFAMHRSGGAQGINLVPLKNNIAILQHAIDTGREAVLSQLMTNIIGNILLFMPLGFLLKWVCNSPMKAGKVLLTGFLASVSIETLQWIGRSFGVYRSVDIDDVILNTTGTLLGWWCYWIVRNRIRPKSQNQHA